MKRGRAYEEASKLAEKYPVRYSEADRRVVIQQFRYPESWNPRFAPLRFDLPSTYPRDMPTVYISTTVSYEHGSPKHLMQFISPPDDSNDEWSKWCIEDHKTGWDPATDTLLKLTTMMRASLANPNSDNPIQDLKSSGDP